MYCDTETYSAQYDGHLGVTWGTAKSYMLKVFSHFEFFSHLKLELFWKFRTANDENYSDIWLLDYVSICQQLFSQI